MSAVVLFIRTVLSSDNDTHIGLISFSTDSTIDMPLSHIFEVTTALHCTNKALNFKLGGNSGLLNTALDVMAHPSGVTNTPAAFRNAGVVLAQSNRSCQIVVLLTDGQPNLPPYSMESVSIDAVFESEILRNNGIIHR